MTILASLILVPPTAVLIHGAGGGGWEYRAWVKPLEKAGYRVVAPDLVPTKAGLAATTFDDYVRQVRSWCPKEGKFVLVGASMGGILALKAAETLHPSAIVLVNGVPPSGTGGKTYPAVVKWANGPLKDSEDSMPDSDRKTILFAWKHWRDESGAVLTTISKGVSVKKPTCPVLVVTGEKDTDIKPEWQHEYGKSIGAEQVVHAEMSHVGPLLGTKASYVAKSVADWCSDRLERK